MRILFTFQLHFLSRVDLEPPRAGIFACLVNKDAAS